MHPALMLDHEAHLGTLPDSIVAAFGVATPVRAVHLTAAGRKHILASRAEEGQGILNKLQGLVKAPIGFRPSRGRFLVVCQIPGSELQYVVTMELEEVSDRGDRVPRWAVFGARRFGHSIRKKEGHKYVRLGGRAP